jgi:hypothetical protein
LIARRPVLLTQRADTLARNIAETASHLGLSRASVLAAAFKNPVWLYLSAPTISLHVRRAAAALRVTKREYVAALQRSPTLVCRDPKALAARARLVCAIASVTGDRLTPRGLLARFPTALTYGAERLKARLRCARAEPKRWQWTSLVSMPAWKLR